MALVGVQVEGQSALCQVLRPPQVVQACQRVAPGQRHTRGVAQAQPFSDSLLAQLIGAFICVGHRKINRSMCLAVAVVIDHQRAFLTAAVRVSKDVFVHFARIQKEVVEPEVAAFGKEPATL